MPAITAPFTPLEARRDMFHQTKTQSFRATYSATARPLSEATEMDLEDEESDFEEYSSKGSFESVSAQLVPAMLHV